MFFLGKISGFDLRFSSFRLLTAMVALACLACGKGRTGALPPEAQGVCGFTVEKRILLAQGVSFGGAGAYETLEGRVSYVLDPRDPRNSTVADIAYAAGEDGLVRFSAQAVVVKPVDMDRGNGALLYHVVNRGSFDTRVLDPEPWLELASRPGGSRESLARLMKQGFTIVFSGWQDDLLGSTDRLRLFAPQALDHGRPMTGEVLAEILGAPGKKTDYLGDDENHRAYAVDPARADRAEMRVHETYADPGELIQRSLWSFARLENDQPIPDSVHVYFPGGFEPFRIYTVRYCPTASPVMGLCFPAVRDLVSFLCSTDTLNPLVGPEGRSAIGYALAYGSSQSGRFLRNFLYLGFNRSLQDLRVFDGVFSNVPGCRMGFFNYRHAQPHRSAGFYPNFDFPFADLQSTDPVTGETGCVLRNVPAPFLPRIFYVHHSAEYWSSGAAFTHADVSGLRDLELPENVRIYHLCGTSHGHAALADGRPEQRPDYFLPFNPNDPALIEAPLLEALARWVLFDEAPPPSSYPRLDKRQLVPLEEFAFPAIPGVQAPVLVELHPRFDWGARFRQGILDNPLPGIGVLYPVLVPVVDSDGNDLAGLKTPELEVPLATYTGWNYPSPWLGTDKTPAGRLCGAWLPLAATRQERLGLKDPRPSLEERYRRKDIYLEKIRLASESLIAKKLMFREDLQPVLAYCSAMYDYVEKHGAWKPAKDLSGGN